MFFSFYNPFRRQERNESKQIFGTNVTSQLGIQHKTRPSPLTSFESKIAQLSAFVKSTSLYPSTLKLRNRIC